MMTFKTFILAICLTTLSQVSIANTQASQAISKEASEIGVMVQKLQVAIQSPNDKNALNVIYLYGTDSRYYSMIRGWLFQELVGVESQLHASKSAANIEKFTLRSDFLKQAIRSIDLE